MKFKAQYLPILGSLNLKEQPILEAGDTFQSKFRSEHKFYHFVTIDEVFTGLVARDLGHPDEIAVYRCAETKVLYPHSDVICKVELHLTTQDVRIGDNIYASPEAVGYDLPLYVNGDVLRECNDKPSTYLKDAGLLSPNAKWVKHGDVFEADQVEVRTIPIYGGKNPTINHWNGTETWGEIHDNLVAKNKAAGVATQMYKFTYARVKCSQCGDLH